jgi:acyl-CoA thioester hydrolase
MSKPEGFAIQHDLRVRFSETDAQAVAYHGSFLVYCETGRVEYYRALHGGAGGNEHAWRQDRGYDVVLAHVEMDFRASARFDDLLTVWTRMGFIGTRSFGFEHAITRGDELMCTGRTVHVAVLRRERTSTPLPPEFRQSIEAFERREIPHKR